MFNYSQNVHISACDLLRMAFSGCSLQILMRPCGKNGQLHLQWKCKQRIQRAQELASLTEADGGILFAHWGCKGTIGASSLIKILWKTQGFQPWSWTATAAIRPIPVTARCPHDFRHTLKCWKKAGRKNDHDTLRL